MKKFTLFAAAVAAAFSANAQYVLTGNAAYVEQSVKNGGEIFDVIVACDEVMQALKDAGKTVNDYRVDDVTRFLYVWDGTFVGGDDSMNPGVGYNGFSGESYTSLNVANGTTWSGAGYNVNKGAGIDLSHLTADTRLHISAYTNNALASVAFTIMDGDDINKPAKVSMGTSYVDNGTTFPTLGDLTDEWGSIDISFADLKKVWPAFDYQANAKKDWTGNIISFLAGAIGGKNICLDAIYFYSPKSSGIEGVIVDDANAPVEYFNLQGVRVDNPENGLYIRRQGSKVEKVVL